MTEITRNKRRNTEDSRSHPLHPTRDHVQKIKRNVTQTNTVTGVKSLKENIDNKGITNQNLDLDHHQRANKNKKNQLKIPSNIGIKSEQKWESHFCD